jgi:glycerol-3-phosphate O-acyltransferase / dihydroxyacetone phosphate acyltransferase
VFYWFIKPFVFIFFRVFYRYDYKGRTNIPFDKPVILAPNHVNAFIDPIALGLLCDRRVRFFARGDVFKNKLAARILEALSISPMFRIQEGYSEIKKNDKTFEECRRRLNNNEVILLFPEAVCVQERRLRPLKKGLSRIVFQTEETMDFKKDVLIIPVGLNYTAAYKFRSKLFIDIGEPISIKDYEEKYKLDKVRTINEFTKVLERKMSERMVILKNTDNDKLFVNLEEIYMYQWLKNKGELESNLENSYHGSKELADLINYIDETNPALTVSLRDKTTEYIKHVRANGLRDHLLRPDSIENITLLTFIAEFFIVILGMPVYAIGMVINYPPYYLAKNYCDKNIKNIEFVASVYANLAMIFWLLYAMIQIVIVGLIFRSWLILSIYTVVFLPLLGYFTLKFYPVKEKIFGRWRLLRLVRKQRHVVEEMVNERFEIISEVERAIKEYKNKLKIMQQ